METLFVFMLGYLCCMIAIILAFLIGRMIKTMRGNRPFDLELYDACSDIISIITRYQLVEKEKAIYDIAAKIKKDMEG